jgi:hypothetical protein
MLVLLCSATALEEDSWGAFLIVETKFKIYAQTEHPYYVYLLSLFCEMKYRVYYREMSIYNLCPSLFSCAAAAKDEL